MQKVNTNTLPEETWTSPKGKYLGFGKQVSIALGRDPQSMDLTKRQPFDIEIQRLPPGKSGCPFHSHSAQWEFYHVISGRGIARDEKGDTPIEPGDAFVFGPGEAHQITGVGPEDLVLYVVADNPVGEGCYYPDSKKWHVPEPKGIIRGSTVDYHDGEE